MILALDHDRCALVHGRALETMRSLFAPSSVDCVITDPPYSEHVHANHGKERCADGRQVTRQALEFPPLTTADIEQLAAEFVRIARSWIIVFCDDRVVETWGRSIERAGGVWIRTGYWVKTSPLPQMSGDRPAAGAESIVISHRTGKGMEWNGKGRAAVWRGGRDHGAEHPNQKPLWLIQALLGMFAPTGGTVLDPFFGSGTTALAAMLAERAKGETTLETSCPKCAQKRVDEYAPPLPQGVRVFGIEGDEKWVRHAIARIAPALAA